MDRIEDRRGEFPPDDPQRRALHDEVHARPPARIVTPERVAHLALRIPPGAREQESRSIAALAALLGVPAPGPSASFAWLEGRHRKMLESKIATLDAAAGDLRKLLPGEARPAKGAKPLSVVTGG